MANRERGEMRLQAGATEYTLRLTLNAACELEDRSGKTLQELQTAAVTRGSMTAFRWLLWGALQDRHGDSVKTPQDAGQVLEAAGGIEALIDRMAEFMTLNAPPEEIAESNGQGGAPRPPEVVGRAGPIGAGSIETPASTAH